METPPLTSLTFPDDRKYVYTALGKRLFWKNSPLFVHDSLRTRPMLVLGSTGYGKTEGLISMAFQDAMKGRFVVFIDGKCDESTRNKLYYYCHRVAKRPFYALMPFQEMDHLTNSWNPFTTSSLGISTIAESFINAYADPTEQKGDGQFYLETQRAVFTLLMRTLTSSGFAFSTQDVRYLLEYEDLRQNLGQIVKGSGVQFYGDLIRKCRDEGKGFGKTMQRFVNHLRLFQHWSLNSYNPTIQFDRLMQTDSVVYVGLPVNSEPYLMSAIGNILVNQLKALSANIQTSEKSKRRAISCIIDEAGTFVDLGLAEWICKVRSSGFLLVLGIQTLANLERKRAGFSEEIRANSPNVMMFNPNEEKTAAWFSTLVGQELKTVASANIKASDETGDGSIKTTEQKKIPVDALMNLRVGQCFYRPPVPIDRPPLLAVSYLPDPPEKEENRHRRLFYESNAEFKGINLAQQINEWRASMGAGSL